MCWLLSHFSFQFIYQTQIPICTFQKSSESETLHEQEESSGEGEKHTHTPNINKLEKENETNLLLLEGPLSKPATRRISGRQALYSGYAVAIETVHTGQNNTARNRARIEHTGWSLRYMENHLRALFFPSAYSKGFSTGLNGGLMPSSAERLNVDSV